MRSKGECASQLNSRRDDFQYRLFLSKTNKKNSISSSPQNLTLDLNKLLSSIPAVVFTLEADPKGTYRVAFASPQIRELFGLSPDEIESDITEVFRRVNPEDRPHVLEAIERSQMSLQPATVEYRFEHPSGLELWVEAHGVPEVQEDGTVLWYGFLSDITERKRSEIHATRWQQFFTGAEVAVALADPINLEFLEVNQKFADMHGYKISELLGKTASMLVTRETWKEIQAHQGKLAPGKNFISRMKHCRKDGTEFPVLVDVSLVKDTGGRVRSNLVLVFDLSAQAELEVALQRKEQEACKLEAQFRQAQKMEAVGRLAGGVAHDFNNILGVILGYGDIVLEQVEQDRKLGRPIQQMKDAALRGAALTRQLLAFSRQQVIFPRALDLNELVRGTTRLLERIVGEDVAIELELRNGLKMILSDPGQMEQMFMNLVLNARDAMPRGGTIVIQTEMVHLDAETAKERELLPGSYVQLKITDTGIGMPPEVQSQIFEPFFTTKGVGKGTGLGLSTVYGVVKQNRGSILVDSEVGRGTTFIINLPEFSGDHQWTEEGGISLESLRGTETILLVEDEEQLRAVTAETLKDAGYKLLEAPNADIALQVMERAGERIDLLLTDLIMPGMNGYDLSRKLQGMAPKLKVVYMSGYTNETIDNIGLRYEEANFLHKPATRLALLSKIRQRLNAKPAN